MRDALSAVTPVLARPINGGHYSVYYFRPDALLTAIDAFDSLTV